MSDKVQLRDHNQPCDCDGTAPHTWRGEFWYCDNYDCPGGRELQATEMDWCSTHKTTWTTDDPNDPDDWCLARYAWADGECVRSTVLIAEDQQ